MLLFNVVYLNFKNNRLVKGFLIFHGMFHTKIISKLNNVLKNKARYTS